jgi:hypothetical protein
MRDDKLGWLINMNGEASSSDKYFLCVLSSVVYVLTRLGLTIRDLTSGREISLFSLLMRPNRLWGPRSLLLNIYLAIFLGNKAVGLWTNFVHGGSTVHVTEI